MKTAAEEKAKQHRLLLRNLKKQENTDAAARMQKKVEVSAAQLAKEPFNKKAEVTSLEMEKEPQHDQSKCSLRNKAQTVQTFEK